MPGVKWVDPNDVYEYRGNYVHRIPVLTLDQIEAWLNMQKQIASDVYGYVSIDHLLAEVQAWKASVQ